MPEMMFSYFIADNMNAKRNNSSIEDNFVSNLLQSRSYLNLQSNPTDLKPFHHHRN